MCDFTNQVLSEQSGKELTGVDDALGNLGLQRYHERVYRGEGVSLPARILTLMRVGGRQNIMSVLTKLGEDYTPENRDITASIMGLPCFEKFHELGLVEFRLRTPAGISDLVTQMATCKGFSATNVYSTSQEGMVCELTLASKSFKRSFVGGAASTKNGAREKAADAGLAWLVPQPCLPQKYASTGTRSLHLNNVAQKHGYLYREAATSVGPPHNRTFTMTVEMSKEGCPTYTGVGVGLNLQTAKEKACDDALFKMPQNETSLQRGGLRDPRAGFLSEQDEPSPVGSPPRMADHVMPEQEQCAPEQRESLELLPGARVGAAKEVVEFTPSWMLQGVSNMVREARAASDAVKPRIENRLGPIGSFPPIMGEPVVTQRYLRLEEAEGVPDAKRFRIRAPVGGPRKSISVKDFRGLTTRVLAPHGGGRRTIPLIGGVDTQIEELESDMLEFKSRVASRPNLVDTTLVPLSAMVNKPSDNGGMVILGANDEGMLPGLDWDISFDDFLNGLDRGIRAGMLDILSPSDYEVTQYAVESSEGYRQVFVVEVKPGVGKIMSVLLKGEQTVFVRGKASSMALSSWEAVKLVREKERARR